MTGASFQKQHPLVKTLPPFHTGTQSLSQWVRRSENPVVCKTTGLAATLSLGLLLFFGHSNLKDRLEGTDRFSLLFVDAAECAGDGGADFVHPKNGFSTLDLQTCLFQFCFLGMDVLFGSSHLKLCCSPLLAGNDDTDMLRTLTISNLHTAVKRAKLPIFWRRDEKRKLTRWHE